LQLALCFFADFKEFHQIGKNVAGFHSPTNPVPSKKELIFLAKLARVRVPCAHS
jgi:hypothetical protein